MKKEVLNRSEIMDKLKEIDKEVIRVLGKHRDKVLTITSRQVFDDYITACIGTGVIAIDTETNNSIDPITCKIMGLCLYSPGLMYAYIPINHRDPKTKARLTEQLTEADIKEGLESVVESKIKIIMHNGNFDYKVLKCTCGIEVVPTWDTMIATKLLNENESAGLKYQYTTKIDKTQESYNIEKLFDGVQYADVSPEIFALYSAVDPYMTYRLYEYQIPLMKSEKKIFRLFQEIEMPLVTIVAEMELCGALVDLEYCEKLKDKYVAKLRAIDTQLDKELCSIKPIIDKWRTKPEGMERERVFPHKKALMTWSTERIEKEFPMLETKWGFRYKLGKPYASQLKEPINLSSPKQLGILLYKILGAPVVNKYKPTGTGKHEIEAIKTKAETMLKGYKAEPEKSKLSKSSVPKFESLVRICELLSERRMVDKLITTYLNSVPKLAHHWKDGKVRFQYNQLGAKTGRFTSGGAWKFYENEELVTIQGLNGQNLPSENHEIRLMFKAEPGRVFVGGDISQQEPKLTAHISLDDNMLQIYEDEKDIYASIAQTIYKNNYEDNLEFRDKEKTQLYPEGKERRKTGKIIILATMYGMGPNSVADKLGINKDEAKDMLKAFYGQYSGVRRAIDTSVSFCKEHGYVEDIWGRKRRLPSIQLPLYMTRFTDEPSHSDRSAERLLRAYLDGKGKISLEELAELRKKAKENKIEIICNEERILKAERQCFNARIQGSAATLTKMIMVMVGRSQLIKKLGGRMIFQIHDELILDCPIENAEAVKNELKNIIEQSSTAVGVVLPMKCDMVTEARWGVDTMTVELKERYQKLIKSEVADPIGELCKEFCNFPEESIRQIICNDNKILEFEW